MKYDKKAKHTIMFTVALTLLMLFGTILTDTYVASANSSSVDKEANSNTIKKALKSNDEEDNLQSEVNTILDIKNQNSDSIEESGSFQVDHKQTLLLSVKSDIKGGTVDLFLFDPNGKEQRITIGSKNFTKKIKLTKGLWAYNCSGIFKEGGNLHITGTIADANTETETDDKNSDNTLKDDTKEQPKLKNDEAIVEINSQNNNNIAESGSFKVDGNQTLILDVESNIKGGTVDLFLIDPNGKEQQISIGSKDFTKEIKVTKGLWSYNCSGVFKEGGKIHITGTIKQ